MPLQRLLLVSFIIFLCASASPAQSSSPAIVVNLFRLPAKEPTDEARTQASAALLAAEDNLFQGNIGIAEKAALDALKLDPSRSLEAGIIATEAAWQASLLPPQDPADRERAQQLLAASLGLHPASPQLALLQARMKLHDGALDEAEALAQSAFEKLGNTWPAPDVRIQRDGFNALLHAQRGEWKSAAKFVIEAEEWPSGYDFHLAAADILERAIKDGNTTRELPLWTRNAYNGAHPFLRNRPRGPEITANEIRQIELLSQMGLWGVIHSMLKETILPDCQARTYDAHLLALLEPIARNKPFDDLAALPAIDNLLGELQPRFAGNPRFLEIRFDWAHATATALLAPDATAVEKTRAEKSIATCESLLPSLGKDWRRQAQILPLLNQAGHHSRADALAQKLFDSAETLGVVTTDDWSALGNAIEFSRGKGKLYENLPYECYDRAFKIDLKTNHINFAAIIGKLRLGQLSGDPVPLLETVNQLAAQFPAEAAARKAEVFFVRKRLCQKIADDGRPLDAVLAYTKLAELTPKDRFVYHIGATSNLVAYLEAAAKDAYWHKTPLPDPKTAFNRPAVEGIFDNILAKYTGDPASTTRLKQERDRLNLAFARGAAIAKVSPGDSATTDALATCIRTLRDASPAHQKSQFNEFEAHVHATRLKGLYDQGSYSQQNLDEARARRTRIEQLGGPNVEFAQRLYTWIESHATGQQMASREQETGTRATHATHYTRAEPESRWRWCMRCAGSGYRTVWENQMDSYTNRFRNVQVNKICDQCWGKGTLPY